MELILPRPHKAQKEILDCKKRFVVLLCGRRFGKSLICSNISILGLLKKERIAYITPTYELASIFFDEIIQLLRGICKTNRTELTIKFNGGEIRFFTGERLDNLRGQKFHKVIIDEASYIKKLKENWENVIRPTLTDFKGRCFFVSTPRGQDYFYSLTQNRGDWKTFKFTTYDNPYIPIDEIEEAKKMLPSAVFEQEYMANPMQNADSPFGSENINKNIKEISKEKALYFGIDLAKSFDYTVEIGLDKNGEVAHFKRYQKSWGHTKEEILKLEENSTGYIDSTGVGDPIVEEISKKRQYLKGFKFTSSSKQQLMEGLVSAVHQGLIKYPKGEITNEMEVFEYKYTNTGVRYSARDGFHDDCVVALALAWKSFVEKKNYGHYAIF